MIFSEKKEKENFVYNVSDVFGEMEFKSQKKLSAEILDQIFLAIFKIESKTEIIKGTIESVGVSYRFKKAGQWDKLDEEVKPQSKEVTNLFNKTKQWLKKSLKKFTR